MRSDENIGEWLHPFLNNETNSRKSTAVDKFLEVSPHSGNDALEKIRIGDRIKSPEGMQGVVRNIEVLRYRSEVHYYFRLEKSAGTILVIK